MAAAAIGGAMANTVFNFATSAFNHKLAEDSADKQYQRQLDFWQKQNQYNDPMAQRARLERAGLNSASLAGDIAGHNTAGNLSTVPGNEYAQKGALDPNALSNSLDLMGRLESVGANTDLMRRQIELTYVEEMIKNSEKYGIDLTNEQRQMLNKWVDDEKAVSIQSFLAEINRMNEETRAKKLDNDEREAAQNEGANKYLDAHEESEVRQALASAQTELVNLQQEYQKFANSHQFEAHEADLKVKASQASANYASALASQAMAAYNKQLAQNASNQDARAAVMHVIQLSMQELEASNLLTQTQADELRLKINTAWNEGIFGSDAKGHRLENLETIINDFFHSNLNLSGGVKYSFDK